MSFFFILVLLLYNVLSSSTFEAVAMTTVTMVVWSNV